LALAVQSISTSLINDDYWHKVFKKIVIALYEAPQKIIAKLLSLCLSFFGFLLDKVVAFPQFSRHLIMSKLNWRESHEENEIYV